MHQLQVIMLGEGGLDVACCLHVEALSAVGITAHASQIPSQLLLHSTSIVWRGNIVSYISAGSTQLSALMSTGIDIWLDSAAMRLACLREGQ